jgi:hypothetical protein
VTVAAFVVSLVAVAVSTGAVVWTKVAADAQRRLTEIEGARYGVEVTDRGRALLTARLVSDDGGTHLDVENYGMAPARDVTLELVARDSREAPRLMDVPFPATIGARTEVCLRAETSMNTAPYSDPVLRWRDAAGPHEERLLLSTP